MDRRPCSPAVQGWRPLRRAQSSAQGLQLIARGWNLTYTGRALPDLSEMVTPYLPTDSISQLDRRSVETRVGGDSPLDLTGRPLGILTLSPWQNLHRDVVLTS